ncbi:MAG: hypothetical protein EBZ48_16765, partial [Proteobacteria bacterium]|nr:hypothetical protein [Pseudomonadota bacterium]
LHPAPRGAQMGWNRVMPEVMRSFSRTSGLGPESTLRLIRVLRFSGISFLLLALFTHLEVGRPGDP